MYPKDWNNRSVSEILERIAKPVEVKPSEHYEEIGVRSHGKGIFYKLPVTGESLGKKRVFHIEPNCLIFNIVFAWEQAVAKTTPKESNMIASHRFPMYRPINSLCDIDYILYFFKSPRGKSLLNIASPGGAGRNKTLGQSDFFKLKLTLPVLEEQKKIAEILFSWDSAIRVTQQLLENSRIKKSSLLQQIFSRKRRLKDKIGVVFEDEWKQARLSDLFNRVTRKNSEKNGSVVTVSAQHGLVRQDEYFKKSVSAESLEGYYLLKKGQFAYNKSYSNGYPMGAIKKLNKYEYGVVTTLYICFEVSDSKKVNGDFFEYYFESGQLNRSLTRIANEGGRAHGLLNVKPADFFSLKVSIPSPEEQTKIVNVLSLADQEIHTVKEKLHCLKQEKKALVQQLLTGKVRVKTDKIEAA